MRLGAAKTARQLAKSPDDSRDNLSSFILRAGRVRPSVSLGMLNERTK